MNTEANYGQAKLILKKNPNNNPYHMIFMCLYTIQIDQLSVILVLHGRNTTNKSGKKQSGHLGLQ